MKLESHYRTLQMRINEKHELFSYCKTMCQNSKNLFNATNFIIRQVYTGLTTNKPLQTLQREALDKLEMSLDPINHTQFLAYQKNISIQEKKPKEKQKEVKLNLFDMPTTQRPFVSYSFLDAYFKQTNDVNYRSVPAQSAQRVIKSVFDAWTSFYESNAEFKVNPEKFTGKPRIPGYCKSAEKEAYLSNQDAVLKKDGTLKLPKTKCRLRLGKMKGYEGSLQEVRIVPSYGTYVMECIFEEKFMPLSDKPEKRLMALDLGLGNLASVVTNTGCAPFIVNGGAVKSINAYYNKQKAHYTQALRMGKQPNEGPFTSKRLEKLHHDRHCQIKDQFHKASHFIVQEAVNENVDVIIIGHNVGWKNEINIGARNNQSFCHIPHHMLIDMITYKARREGIKVVVQEESYTSKASFLDNDIIPTYAKGLGGYAFSGTREKRGLYKSKQGDLINADINGSANILRKYAKARGILEGIVHVFGPRKHCV